MEGREGERGYKDALHITNRELTEFEKHQAFVNEFLLKSAHATGAAATAVLGLDQKIQNMDRAWGNFKETLGAGEGPLGSTVSKLVEMKTSFIELMSALAKEHTVVIDVQMSASPEVEAVLGIKSHRGDVLGDLGITPMSFEAALARNAKTDAEKAAEAAEAQERAKREADAKAAAEKKRKAAIETAKRINADQVALRRQLNDELLAADKTGFDKQRADAEKHYRDEVTKAHGSTTLIADARRVRWNTLNRIDREEGEKNFAILTEFFKKGIWGGDAAAAAKGKSEEDLAVKLHGEKQLRGTEGQERAELLEEQRFREELTTARGNKYLLEEVEAQHQDRLAAIQRQGLDERLSAATQFAGKVAKLAEIQFGGKKGEGQQALGGFGGGVGEMAGGPAGGFFGQAIGEVLGRIDDMWMDNMRRESEAGMARHAEEKAAATEKRQREDAIGVTMAFAAEAQQEAAARQQEAAARQLAAAERANKDLVGSIKEGAAIRGLDKSLRHGEITQEQYDAGVFEAGNDAEYRSRLQRIADQNNLSFEDVENASKYVTKNVPTDAAILTGTYNVNDLVNTNRARKLLRSDDTGEGSAYQAILAAREDYRDKGRDYKDRETTKTNKLLEKVVDSTAKTAEAAGRVLDVNVIKFPDSIAVLPRSILMRAAGAGTSRAGSPLDQGRGKFGRAATATGAGGAG